VKLKGLRWDERVTWTGKQEILQHFDTETSWKATRPRFSVIVLFVGNCPSRKTGKSTAVLKTTHFIEKCNKVAYKN
jgi:hypothetical protein